MNIFRIILILMSAFTFSEAVCPSNQYTNNENCVPMVHGCTNSYANNYNSAATHNDGSCVIPFDKLKNIYNDGNCTY